MNLTLYQTVDLHVKLDFYIATSLKQFSLQSTFIYFLVSIINPQVDPGHSHTPFFEPSYRLVKTCFNTIFPVSSLSFFFLHCFVISALNYVSISFDISIKKMVSEIKQIPLMEMSGSASAIHVHLYIGVQCGPSSICEYGTTISVVDCEKKNCFGE